VARGQCDDFVAIVGEKRKRADNETTGLSLGKLFEGSLDIGVGTLVYHARQSGWQDPADTQASAAGLLDIANGQRFAETFRNKLLWLTDVKELTGGDTLIGRGTYAKAFIKFQQTHKLLISGNYKTEIRDNSTGMWERMILVPFVVTIPEANRDLSLGDTLKAEASGILNWMLAGLRDYQTNGLKVPQAIRAATAAYRTDQDLVGEWVTENCVTGAGLREDKRILYANYADWAKEAGYKQPCCAQWSRI
jgi:hypothetical protein